jgi:hypothetical protein
MMDEVGAGGGDPKGVGVLTTRTRYSRKSLIYIFIYPRGY